MPLGEAERWDLRHGARNECGQTVHYLHSIVNDTGGTWNGPRDKIDGLLEAEELLRARCEWGEHVFDCWADELHHEAALLEEKLWNRWHGITI